jgi:hypothetical protein
MNTLSKSRLVSLVGACLLVSGVACIDAPTAPKVSGRIAARDTVVTGDSTLCRNGYIIYGGRIICRDE